jgi:hypothetical protein
MILTPVAVAIDGLAWNNLYGGHLHLLRQKTIQIKQTQAKAMYVQATTSSPIDLDNDNDGRHNSKSKP